MSSRLVCSAFLAGCSVVDDSTSRDPQINTRQLEPDPVKSIGPFHSDSLRVVQVKQTSSALRARRKSPV
jgi:hypothetical protein